MMLRLIVGARDTFIACAFLTAIGWLTSPPGQPPRLLREQNPWLRALVEGSWTTVVFLFSHPVPVLIGVAALGLPLLLATLLTRLPRRITKDPQRLFSADQRRTASELAGGRCEMEGLFFTRCRRPGQAGDHWFPHSKGGSTSMDNLVWACSTCNGRKSAQVPGLWLTLRIEWRRRRYFPPHLTARPGARFGPR